MCVCARCHRSQKEGSVLVLELQVSNLMWVLGTKLGSSGGAASGLTTEPSLQPSSSLDFSHCYSVLKVSRKGKSLVYVFPASQMDG